MANQDTFTIFMIIISLLFAVVLISIIYSRSRKMAAPKNELSNFKTTGTDLSKLKKISSRPFLFGMEGKLISEEDLYFDDQHLYAVNNISDVAKFNLTDICSLGRTSTQINNRTVWTVEINNSDGSTIIFKFTHNYTLWNKNFAHFYERVKELNPHSIKSEWSLWRM